MSELPKERTTVTVAVGITQTLGYASSYYLPAILAVPIAHELGLKNAWVFGAFSCALLVSAALGPAVGRMIDARGGRDVLVISNLVFAIGLASLAVAQGPFGLIAAWLVIGIGMAMGLYEAAFSTLAGLFGSSARGPITGVTLIAGFASTVGWPLSTLLNAQIGWRETCFVWAAAHLIMAAPMHWLFVPASTGSHRSKPMQEARSSNASPVLITLLAYVFAAGWFVATAMAAHLPRLLHEGGASVEAAVIAGALIGPAQVVARLIEFGLLQRAHPLTSARVAVLLHPAGALLFGAFGAPAALFAILHGAGNGLLTIAIGTLPLALFGAVGYGLRQGLLVAPARVAQAGAPFLFGLLIDSVGVSALAVTSGLLAAAFVALALIGRLAKVQLRGKTA